MHRLEIVNILLEAGADPNLCQDFDTAPLGGTILSENIEIIEHPSRGNYLLPWAE